MKIYSYLHSGTALLATDLPTHRQVLDDSIAMLVAPEPQAFADGLSRLIADHQLRQSLGRHAQAIAEQLYTTEAFERQISTLYATVSQQINLTADGRDTICSNV
jgi:glycosyltransferase involved in cell wall biosynthesis